MVGTGGFVLGAFSSDGGIALSAIGVILIGISIYFDKEV